MAQPLQDQKSTTLPEDRTEDRVRRTAVLVMLETLAFACMMSTYGDGILWDAAHPPFRRPPSSPSSFWNDPERSKRSLLRPEGPDFPQTASGDAQALGACNSQRCFWTVVRDG